MAVDTSNLKTWKIIFYIILGLFIASIVINIFLGYKLATFQETFCTCQEMVNKTCPNPKVLTDLYNKNILTEYTNLKGKNWPDVMPYDRFNHGQQTN